MKPLHIRRRSTDGLAPLVPPFQREDSGTRPRRISDYDYRDHPVSSPTVAGSENQSHPVTTTEGLSRTFGNDANHPVFSSCFADLGRGVTESAKSQEQHAERAVSLATLYGGGSFNDFRVIASLPR